MSEVKIKIGDVIPEGIFVYVPYTSELDNPLACGIPSSISTNDWKGKKVILVSIPGAFTPTCHALHIPPYIQDYDKFKAKGVDVIAVLAANDPFVMSGWARAEGFKDKILALSDPNAKWSASLGLSIDLTARDFGIRTNRYAIVLDDLKVVYIGVESAPGVTVSGADEVLAHL